MKVRFRFKDGIYGEVKGIEFAIKSMTQNDWREEQKAIEHRIESLSRTNGLEEEVKHLYFLLKEKVNSFNVRKIEDVLTVADEKVLTSVEELNDVVNIRKSGLGFEDYQYSSSPQGNTIVWEGEEEVLIIAPLSDELKDELRYDDLWKSVDIEDADEMELTEEELKELFLQFDLSGINGALSERLGFEVNLKAYVEEKPRVNRYSLYDETDHSKDTSFMDMLFTKLTIGTFSGGWSKVNSYFWFGIDIFYSTHGGGSNGVEFAGLEIYPDGEYNLTFNKDKYK